MPDQIAAQLGGTICNDHWTSGLKYGRLKTLQYIQRQADDAEKVAGKSPPELLPVFESQRCQGRMASGWLR